MRKRLIRGGLLVVLVAVVAAGEDSWVFRGEIADSQCALNVHSLTRSHQEMLKSKSMGGTSASCTLYCVQHMGGSLVLTARKHVYRLEQPELAQPYMGEKVKINGSVDSKTDTIHIVKIEQDE